MKRAILILVGGLLAGVTAYACSYLQSTSAKRAAEQSSRPELDWLQKEYHLTPAQYQQAVQLHDAYSPRCAEMCRRIDEKNAKVQSLLAATNTVTDEIKQALAEAAQLRVECQSAMMQHFFEISRAMPPDQGKRYLAWVQQETLLPGQMAPTSPGSPMAHH
jgi:Spy/CpxP family protein refolding chaperone